MFLKLREPKICKGVLERLLQIKIDRLEYPELQKTISPFYTQKGVRLDVYVAGNDKIFDVECQTYRIKNIGKRTRYYQSMIDMDSLLKGTDYAELKESYIIFICLDDPFGAGLPVYTFERNNTAESDFTKEIATMVQAKKFQNTFLNEYLAIQLHERDVEERAEQRGIASKAKESARNALALGLSAAQVAQITGLSLSEIAAL